MILNNYKISCVTFLPSFTFVYDVKIIRYTVKSLNKGHPRERERKEKIWSLYTGVLYLLVTMFILSKKGY